MLTIQQIGGNFFKGSVKCKIKSFDNEQFHKILYIFLGATFSSKADYFESECVWYYGNLFQKTFT